MDSRRCFLLTAAGTILLLVFGACSSKEASDYRPGEIDGQELAVLFEGHCLRVLDFERIAKKSKANVKKQCSSIFGTDENCAVSVGGMVDQVVKYQSGDEVKIEYSWQLGLHGEHAGKPQLETLTCGLSVDARHEAALMEALQRVLSDAMQVGKPANVRAKDREYWQWAERYHHYSGGFKISASRSNLDGSAPAEAVDFAIAPVLR